MTQEAIVKAATKMSSTRDLLNLLNKIKMAELGDRGHPFTMPQLNYFINPKRTGSHYHTFTIPKKSGGVRTISAPVNMLKSFQRYVSRILEAFYEVPECVTGFVQSKSVVDNAERHLGMRYVFNTDLKDFFPSISQARVWGTLKSRPFGFDPKVAGAIAGICGIEVNEGDTTKYVLPQGSPCSPILTNIVCHNLDWKLSGVAKRFHLRYSRYADDITFSSNHYVYEEGGEFLTELRRVIESEHFTINDKKTRLQRVGSRQEVTGLVVSDRPNVPREYVRDLDNLLYIWEKHGRHAAFTKFLSRYCPKHNLIIRNPDMESVVGGKLNYLKMVKGEDSPVWRRLQKRFNRLTKKKASAGGTDIEYRQVWTIAAFEKSVGAELHLMGSEGPSFFTLNGTDYGVTLSKYCRTRLTNILAACDEKALAKFKENFHIVYCHREGTPEDMTFWMIIRRTPKTKSKYKIIEPEAADAAIEQLLAITRGSSSKDSAKEDAPKDDTLSTDQVLEALVSSDFDLNTLDKWEKIRNSN